MAGLILLVILIVVFVAWIKAVADYDGSRPDFCEDCDPEHCPFPCEKNMHN